MLHEKQNIEGERKAPTLSERICRDWRKNFRFQEVGKVKFKHN